MWTGSRARPALRGALAEEGVPPAEQDAALERVARAVATSIGSTRGRWLFAQQHANARSEFALTTLEDRRLLRIVVDRTFVDEAGVRWIVDFKTSAHKRRRPRAVPRQRVHAPPRAARTLCEDLDEDRAAAGSARALLAAARWLARVVAAVSYGNLLVVLQSGCCVITTFLDLDTTSLPRG